MLRAAAVVVQWLDPFVAQTFVNVAFVTDHADCNSVLIQCRSACVAGLGCHDVT